MKNEPNPAISPDLPADCGTDGQEKMLTLAPLAVRELENILKDPKTSVYTQIEAIDLILNRVYGRPETAVRMETEAKGENESGSMAASILETIRERGLTHA